MKRKLLFQCSCEASVSSKGPSFLDPAASPTAVTRSPPESSVNGLTLASFPGPAHWNIDGRERISLSNTHYHYGTSPCCTRLPIKFVLSALVV